MLFPFVLLAIAGTILVTYKRWQGFLCWTISDIVLFVYNLATEEYAQASLWGVYLCLAVWGLLKWRREK